MCRGNPPFLFLWSIFLRKYYSQLAGLRLVLQFSAALSLSVPWPKEDYVFCWETAEAFPPLLTVFSGCTSDWRKWGSRKEDGKSCLGVFPCTPLMFSSSPHKFRHLVTDSNGRKSASRVTKALSTCWLCRLICLSPEWGHLGDRIWKVALFFWCVAKYAESSVLLTVSFLKDFNQSFSFCGSVVVSVTQWVTVTEQPTLLMVVTFPHLLWSEVSHPCWQNMIV